MTQPKSYRAIDAHNFSSLKAMATSPKQYKHELDNPRQIAAGPLGNLFHVLTLEPETFPDRYVVVESKPTEAKGPEWDAYESGRAVLCPFARRAGNEYKEWAAPLIEDGIAILIQSEWDKCEAWADYLALVGDKEIVTRSMLDQAEAMAHAAHHCEHIRPYLNAGGLVEQVMIWTDAETGEKCKGIADLIVGDTLIDLKGWQDLSPRGVRAAMARWMTHVQVSMYRDGAIANGHDIKHVFIAAVEKDAPHDTILIRLSLDEMAAGRATYRRWLRDIARCRENNHWPGMYETIQEDTVPEWAAGMETFNEIEV